MDALKWKQGDRVVVTNEPERPVGTIHGDSLLASPGGAHIRFWPVLFDDYNEKMIEESALEAAPSPERAREGEVKPRFRPGEVVKSAGPVAATVVRVTLEDGKPKYELRVVITEDELEASV